MMNEHADDSVTGTLRSARSLLVFGGSFDPPHIGHARLPELARRQLELEWLVYVPAAASPFKTGTMPTPAKHRIAMLETTLTGNPHAVVWTDEVDRVNDGQPSYTVDTLERLNEMLAPETTVRLLIGADQAVAFDRWRDWQRIETLAEPAVMVRPPMSAATLLEQLPASFDREKWEQRIVELPLMDVSSTEIRRRVAAGESIEGMVNESVADYIRRHHLYKSDPSD